MNRLRIFCLVTLIVFSIGMSNANAQVGAALKKHSLSKIQLNNGFQLPKYLEISTDDILKVEKIQLDLKPKADFTMFLKEIETKHPSSHSSTKSVNNVPTGRFQSIDWSYLEPFNLEKLNIPSLASVQEHIPLPPLKQGKLEVELVDGNITKEFVDYLKGKGISCVNSIVITSKL